jgi:hypothetical protein
LIAGGGDAAHFIAPRKQKERRARVPIYPAKVGPQ